jgi:hypothetical protein
MILVGSLYIYLLGGRRGEMGKGAGKGVVEKNNHYHEHYFGRLRDYRRSFGRCQNVRTSYFENILRILYKLIKKLIDNNKDIDN